MRHVNTINEMAKRLRAADRWDNSLSDRVNPIIELLEDVTDAGFTPPILMKDGFESSKQQLVAVTSHRIAICPADVASCLTMASLLSSWQREGVEAPEIRLGAGGFVVAEWSGKKGGHVMIQHGQVFMECAPDSIKLALHDLPQDPTDDRQAN